MNVYTLGGAQQRGGSAKRDTLLMENEHVCRDEEAKQIRKRAIA